MIVFAFFIAAIYIFYVCFESFSGLARFAGGAVGHMSVGVSLQNQILSLNRFVGFLIAPMIGLYVDVGGQAREIFLIGLLGSVVGGVGLIVIFFYWSLWAKIFGCTSVSLVKHGYSVGSFLKARKEYVLIESSPLKKYRTNYVVAQVFTTGLAMPSVFVLNILALKFSEYSSTILQMTTLISGVGNLLLNFYTVPLLSVEESKKAKADVEDIHKSIYLGKILGIIFFSPIILSIYFLV